MPAPTLHTSRLTLRAHTLSDLDALCDLFETDRAQHMGGPVPRKEAWRWMASEVAMWDLLGHGAWGIETKDGTFVGQVGVLKPPHFPEPELGWTVLENAEGFGYAAEAARVARDWFWDKTGTNTLVSYIAPENERSIKLAERLGARLEPQGQLPDGEDRMETTVWRHMREGVQ